MSLFAQSRDLNDPKTIRDFADMVQSRERLKLLLILTVADIRAVGPGTWTGLEGPAPAHALLSRPSRCWAAAIPNSRGHQRMPRAQGELRERLADWPQEDLDRFIDRHYPAYWLRTDLDVIIEHAQADA